MGYSNGVHGRHDGGVELEANVVFSLSTVQ